MAKYDHSKIEKKWQKEWAKNKIYKTPANTKRPKAYVLDMFPYPSGEGLHVGHPKGYIATDIYARFHRMKGFNVLHPMGWDAFGLPAENYAIKNKINPEIAVKKNIKRFKDQLEQIGFDYDWGREINTTDPAYYRWTQWIFLQLYKKGLAYESYEPINWCPSCKTGLANEDLEDGRCERCGSVVEKRPMRQWVLKITDYAERLLDDLKDLNWPEHIKESQKNWIGKSEGAEIDFESDLKYHYVFLHGFQSSSRRVFFPWLQTELEKRGHTVTALDLPDPFVPNVEAQTDFAMKNAKFDENTIIVAHSLGTLVALRVLERLNKPIRKVVLVAGLIEPSFADKPRVVPEVMMNWKFDFEKIKKNVKDIRILGDLHDDLIAADQAGKIHKHLGGELVEFTAKEPHACGATEPVVLEQSLDLIRVFTTRPDTLFGATYVVLAPEHHLVNHLEKKITNLLAVRKYQHEALQKTEIERTAETKEKTGVKLESVNAINPANGQVVPIFVADYVLPDYGTGAIMAVPAHDTRDWLFAKKFKLPIKEVIKGGQVQKEAYTGSGPLVNSGEFDGEESFAAKRLVTDFVEGRFKINYRLKDWVFSRQRYWGEPIPLIHCENCGVVPVPEKDLPVILPRVKSYEPTGTGESPLASISSWVKVKCPVCGSKGKRETNTMPQWAGSSWYYLRYLDPDNSKTLVDKKKEAYWSPVDMYVGGAEHATRHLIYARFWHKFLLDIGVVNYPEPFNQLKNVGLIMGADGRKMSKRWGNVVNPDDVVRDYGADTLRIYEMFMGPFEQSNAWNTDNMMGARRFVERVWRLAGKVSSKAKRGEAESLVEQTIKKVTEDISAFSFNTAISAMMILSSALEREETVPQTYFENFLKILAPFAPHLTEELWHNLGHKKTIHLEEWPKFDPRKLKSAVTIYVVQINGKVRANLNLPTDSLEEEVKKVALENELVKKWLEGKTIKKVIFIKNKLINLVAL